MEESKSYGLINKHHWYDLVGKNYDKEAWLKIWSHNNHNELWKTYNLASNMKEILTQHE